MCRLWIHSCGHTSENECAAYQNNLVFRQGNKAADRVNDIKVDTPARRASIATPRRSSVATPGRSSLAGSRKSSIVDQMGGRSVSFDDTAESPETRIIAYGASPDFDQSRPATDMSVMLNIVNSRPQLPENIADSMPFCNGPRYHKTPVDRLCFACLLVEVQKNPHFHKMEDAAREKLYNGIHRRELGEILPESYYPHDPEANKYNQFERSDSSTPIQRTIGPASMSTPYGRHNPMIPTGPTYPQYHHINQHHPGSMMSPPQQYYPNPTPVQRPAMPYHHSAPQFSQDPYAGQTPTLHQPRPQAMEQHRHGRYQGSGHGSEHQPHSRYPAPGHGGFHSQAPTPIPYPAQLYGGGPQLTPTPAQYAAQLHQGYQHPQHPRPGNQYHHGHGR